MRVDLSGQRVLVTGGTGFIGGRLVERLVLESNARVRVLVRDYTKIARIARFPVELMYGDLLDADGVHRAMQDVDLVFHCAYGNKGDQKRQVNVDGTGNILGAALQAKVRRVIHLSTIMVYGLTPEGDCDERSPKIRTGNSYGDSKIDAENLVYQYWREKGLPAVILQPTAVYGPCAPVWTVDVLQQLKSKRCILVNGGDGLCNAVYIDDLVSAMLQSAVNPQALGEAFIISGASPVPWRTFYGKFEEMLGMMATVGMSAVEARNYYQQQLAEQRPKPLIRQGVQYLRDHGEFREALMRSREAILLKKFVCSITSKNLRSEIKSRINKGQQTIPRRAAPVRMDKEISPLSPLAIDFFAAKMRMRIDKAQKILDYQPLYDLNAGMKLTEMWARWARIL